LCSGLFGSGRTDEELLSDMVASSEYFTARTDGTNAGYVEHLYTDLLNRAADPGANAYITCLNASSCTRSQVATSILGSAEYRGTFCTGWYHQFLHRAPAGSDKPNCVAALGSATDEQEIAAIIGSGEYQSGDVPAGVPVKEEPFTGVVASFTGTDPAADYTATISWGDGSTSTGTVAQYASSAGVNSFYVTGSYTYAEEGAEPAGAVVVDDTVNIAEGLATVEFDVADAGLTTSSVLLQPHAGSNFSGKVATFTDADSSGTSSDYTVTIDWGDGTTTTGTVVTGAPGEIDGSHMYASQANYAVNVTATDPGGATTSVTDLAEVAVPSWAAFRHLKAVAHGRGVKITWYPALRRIAGYRLARFRSHSWRKLHVRTLIVATRYHDPTGRAGDRYRLQAVGVSGQIIGSATVVALR
jgi:Domain of unknown function (DUF4214)